MARSTTLSDEAFAALRAEKRPGESDSDVVLRLRHEARVARRDPRSFVKRPAKLAFDEATWDANAARMREADRRNPWNE